MSRPRLLLVSPLPPPAGGIATWTVRMLASSLTERFDVRVVNTNTGTASLSELGLNARKLALSATFFARTLRELARFRPQVVHVNAAALLPGLYKDLAYVRAARAAGARTVLELHGSQVEALREPVHAVARHQLRRVDRVLVLTERVEALLTQIGARATRLGNPVAWKPPIDRADRTGPVRVLFVGWVMPAKGVHELIEAVAAVADVTLTLVGRFIDDAHGTSADRVRAQVERLGVGSRVQVLGEVPLEAVWEHYARADVFALPSHTEGLPNTVLEAMMAGLPCVVTDVGAMADAVGDGGVVVPVRDPGALAAALRGLVDPSRRAALGGAARARAIAAYETEAVAGRLIDVYASLLGT